MPVGGYGERTCSFGLLSESIRRLGRRYANGAYPLTSNPAGGQSLLGLGGQNAYVCLNIYPCDSS